jgi:hypothetical protein
LDVILVIWIANAPLDEKTGVVHKDGKTKRALWVDWRQPAACIFSLRQFLTIIASIIEAIIVQSTLSVLESHIGTRTILGV